jgi:tetratricopeptide (TPR) repeat protein
MVRFRVTARQSGYFSLRIAICVLALSALLAPTLIHGRTAQGQSQNPTGSATLQGTVRNSHGDAIAAATVYLQLKTGTQILTVRTDSDGAYRFSTLSDGVYTLRAEIAGYSSTIFSPCVLAPRETKRVDLTLESTTVSAGQSGSGTSGADKPQFFDEPKFIVAGVTEAMSPGGHGSNAILRTTEALAKETASLGAAAAQPSNSRTASTLVSPRAAAEQSLRDAVEHEPGNFEANYRLGKLLSDDGKSGEALPYLERASQLNPDDFESAYELAFASAAAGQYGRAHTLVRSLLNLDDKATQNKSAQQKADLHRLLGDMEEKLGNPLEAVREYQRAAELDPSEPNLFDWGADLLIHRAFEPAVEVFAKGNRLFPRSARMLAGLGVARYARGSYDQAAQSLCEASDLNPDDPNPYLFMGKMQSVETSQSECQAERLARFAALQPENALANYYYALNLSTRKSPEDASSSTQVESLLEKAIRLDAKLGPAYLQLGILYSERGDSSKAVSAYEKAIEVNPQLEEAHYRLSQTYRRAGEILKAQQELQLYEQIKKKKQGEVERQRREIPQLVYTLRDQTPATQP